MLFRLFTVLAVVALAVSTWILSSPAHRPRPAEGGSKTDLPGYYLTNTVLTDFDAAGAPSMRIDAQRIDQIDHSVEVVLSTVTVNYVAPNGQNWIMVGDTAHLQPGGKVVDVRGRVRVEGRSAGPGPSTIIHTDTLTYDIPQATVTTAAAVSVEFGAHTLGGQGLTANLKERTIHIESKVNGRFLP